MKNSFKEIQNKGSASKGLKKRILDDIAFISYTIEFHKLVIKKYPKTLTSYLKKQFPNPDI